MKRLYFWWTDKPYACGCGVTFRNEAALQRHAHRHIEAEFRAARR